MQVFPLRSTESPKHDGASVAVTPPARITLIRPPILQAPMSYSAYGAIPPLGLAYVAAVLRDAGHAVAVIDAPGEAIDRFLSVSSPVGTLQLNGLTVDEVIERLDLATEIVGITHMFLHEWPTIREIAEKVKARIPGVTVVLGGENASAFWPWIFKQTTAVDYVVRGEGEATMLELVARLRAGQPTHDMQGLACRATGIGAPVTVKGRMTQLERVPWPAWEYFNMAGYLGIADTFGVNRGRAMPILATRGCPYQCTFCSSPSMWTTKYVTREPREVVDELKDYVTRFGVTNVNFCDLTAIIEREWILKFCRILKEEQLDLSWQLPSGTRSEALDEDVLRAMYESGCRNCSYSPESGSERMLDLIKKRVKLPKLLASVKAAERQGMRTRISIIVGQPAERRGDTWKSLKLVVKTALMGCHDCSVMIFAPYPGSADFERLVSEDQVNISDKYYYVALVRTGRTPFTYNPQMGRRELVLIQLGMLLAFYAIAYVTRPWRFVELFRGLVTGREENILHLTIRTKMQQLKRFWRARRSVSAWMDANAARRGRVRRSSAPGS